MNLALVFQSGDPVLIGVFVSLVLMSMATWAIILIRTISVVLARKASREAQTIIWAAQNLEEAEIAARHFKDSPIGELTLKSIELRRQFYSEDKKRLSSLLPEEQFLEREISHTAGKILNRFDGGLTALASIGSTAPFVGLFGTVWGIYHALINISQSGQMSIAAVAGPIGEALVATAAGLAVAIPAVLAYNFLTRSNKTLARRLNNFAHNFYILLINSKE